MGKFIAYYRVSTSKQGESGLGLEAQETTARRFAAGGEIIAEYREIESGKQNARPVLSEAIAHATREGATLLIARLDRLSRNAAFVLALQSSGVAFTCCDMPAANNLTIGIMALLAQSERERISTNTKAALQALKERGAKLGTPANLTDEARERSVAVRKANAANNDNWRRAGALAIELHRNNASLRKIAESLNSNGYHTREGKPFQAMTVKRLLERASA